MTRFGPMAYECLNETLSRVKQNGTLKDYQREFERLSNRVVGWPQITGFLWVFKGGTLVKKIMGDIGYEACDVVPQSDAIYEGNPKAIQTSTIIYIYQITAKRR